MKLKLFILIAAIVFAIPSFAQKHGNKDHEAKKKEMLEFKLKFLSEQMELKEEQKKQFYEVYSQMESERRAIYKKIRNAEKSIKNNKDASEADYDKASKEITEAKAEMAQIEKKYDDKLATFLSKKQLYKLKEAETTFTEKMRSCRDKKKSEKKKE